MAPLTIPALRGFVTLVDEGSFSAAAKRLGVTQPAISAQIRTLEEHFGAKLFERAGRSWKPTAAGEQLYAHASDLNDVAQRMEESMASFGTGPEGRLDIAASTAPGEFLLPALLGPFCERFPAIRIGVHVADTASAVEQILLRRVDLGTLGAAVAADKLELTPFATDELLLIAPADHSLDSSKPVKIDDLVFQPWVLRERGSGTRTIITQAMAAIGLDLERLAIVLELGTTGAVKTAVKAGVGLSFVSSLALDPDEIDASIKVLHVPGLNTKRTLYLAVERGRARRNSVEAVLDYLSSDEVAPMLTRLHAHLIRGVAIS
jgi:DNA-binding transcriptional LysR family regulator